MEVSLMQILNAREARVLRQQDWIRRFQVPVISFSMNIPGPVKHSPLISRAFFCGCTELDQNLPSDRVVQREIFEAVTGCEALYAVDMDPLALKEITTKIEDSHGLGRLFDLDVIGLDLRKIDRESVGGGSRNCIVCGAPGKICASRRIHSVTLLQDAVRSIMTNYFSDIDSLQIGDLAVKSLLDEVCVTPKPGLVDLRNNGSHSDMDPAMFQASAAALGGYFQRCAKIGMETSGKLPKDTFLELRRIGLLAEQTMYSVTHGVNTHKGAIFTLGILCGAAGRLWKPDQRWDETALFQEASAMTRETMELDFAAGGDTAGHRLYSQYGLRGIRGQAAQGFPAVEMIGLPVFRCGLARGDHTNDAAIHTLLHLICHVEDTNMIARGGLAAAAEAAQKVRQVLQHPYTQAEVEALDDWFIARNLSPGGCADLLAAVFFVHGLNRM